MNKTIVINNREINYELNRKNVKNLNLRIKPDGTISVSVNNRVSQEKIDSFLVEHSDFILNTLKKYEEYESTTFEGTIKIDNRKGTSKTISILCKCGC